MRSDDWGKREDRRKGGREMRGEEQRVFKKREASKERESKEAQGDDLRNDALHLVLFRLDRAQLALSLVIRVEHAAIAQPAHSAPHAARRRGHLAL